MQSLTFSRTPSGRQARRALLSLSVARRDLKNVMQSAEKLRGLTSFLCITHMNSGVCYSRMNVYICVQGPRTRAWVVICSEGAGERPAARAGGERELQVGDEPRVDRGDPVPDTEDDDDLALAAEIQQQRRVGERGRPRPSSSLRLLPCRGGRGGRGFLL